MLRLKQDLPTIEVNTWGKIVRYLCVGDDRIRIDDVEFDGKAGEYPNLTLGESHGYSSIIKGNESDKGDYYITDTEVFKLNKVYLKHFVVGLKYDES